jgi:hypothetical protein
VRVRVRHIERKGEVTTPVPGDLHGEINGVLLRSPMVLAEDGVEVYSHHATSPHVPDGVHDVYWLNDPKPGHPISWDDDSVLGVFGKPKFWESFEGFLREKQSEIGESARSYMYWGFHLPGDEQPEFPVVWRGLQSQPRLHFHVADSVEDEVADDWLDSAQMKDVGQVARFLNLAGELAQVRALENRTFGKKFTYQQNIYGNEPPQSVDRTLYAFESLSEAIAACVELRADSLNNWLMLSLALNQGPAVFSGQAFEVFQSAVPNFVFAIPSSKDAQRAGRKEHEVWVSPFSVIGAPDILTAGGIVLARR